jgi:hypothetical protein
MKPRKRINAGSIQLPIVLPEHNEKNELHANLDKTSEAGILGHMKLRSLRLEKIASRPLHIKTNAMQSAETK